jgi:hypothetical protein
MDAPDQQDDLNCKQRKPSMPQAQFFHASSVMPISHAVRAGDLVMTATLGPHFFRIEEVTYDADGRVIDDGSGQVWVKPAWS